MLLSHEKSTKKTEHDDNEYEKIVVNEYLQLI